MSEQYTPTTEELRILYVSSEIECPGGATHDADDARANAEFDRYLAEHDRQVAERAWDACRQAAYDETGNDYLDDVLGMANPHRVARGTS